MNALHREAAASAGLHQFQELSTLGQQVAHTLLLRYPPAKSPPSPAGKSRGTSEQAGSPWSVLSFNFELIRADTKVTD
jgi:hypothetical protein